MPLRPFRCKYGFKIGFSTILGKTVDMFFRYFAGAIPVEMWIEHIGVSPESSITGSTLLEMWAQNAVFHHFGPLGACMF